MLVGVTTRRYARSLEPLLADLPSRGTSPIGFWHQTR
jgi:hypothetical protein